MTDTRKSNTERGRFGGFFSFEQLSTVNSQARIGQTTQHAQINNNFGVDKTLISPRQKMGLIERLSKKFIHFIFYSIYYTYSTGAVEGMGQGAVWASPLTLQRVETTIKTWVNTLEYS
ncbi:unnamed protein product [Colias eurytheme]|nr:unnamed protein product [Colias eurytheme]